MSTIEHAVCPRCGHGVERKKNPHAVALGRLGGRKGGLMRAAKLKATRRAAIAKHAAQCRWNKDKESKEAR